MSVNIRPMTENDDLELVTDWFEKIGPEWLLDYAENLADRADVKAHIQKWMRGEDGRSKILVAEDEQSGGIVGFATCLLQSEPFGERVYGTIHGIYVDPKSRGQGAGRTLKEAADQWCRQAGAAYMRAYVKMGNEAMLRVCKLLGYEPWMVTWIRRFE